MIHSSGTFEYEAEFTTESFRDSDIVLHGSTLRGENRESLVGHSPMIRFWDDRVILVASGRLTWGVRNTSFAIGDAVTLSACPGDRLYIVRTGSGGIGLSLIRQESLVFATGAVTAVPMGKDIRTIRGPKSRNPFMDPILDTWLEFRIGNERLILQNREVTEIGGYHIYVENRWQDGVPGTDECVSICAAQNSAMKIAAMRSAIFLGNGDLKTTNWDCTEHFTEL